MDVKPDMLITILMVFLIGVGAIGLLVIALIFALWYMENKQ
jgi:phage shock protein PspC (stress-responsive transcriptional regulator)